MAIACINIVVAANAGGAFSPFGDITTLMVWQKDILGFFEFFVLFIPAVVNFVIPAPIMHFFVPDEHPAPSDEVVEMKDGAKMIMVLFGLTIATAVSFHQFLHLPPMVGMMTGLGYLKLMGYYLKKRAHRLHERTDTGQVGDVAVFDVFAKVARAEWDTLLSIGSAAVWLSWGRPGGCIPSAAI